MKGTTYDQNSTIYLSMDFRIHVLMVMFFNWNRPYFFKKKGNCANTYVTVYRKPHLKRDLNIIDIKKTICLSKVPTN